MLNNLITAEDLKRRYASVDSIEKALNKHNDFIEYLNKELDEAVRRNNNYLFLSEQELNDCYVFLNKKFGIICSLNFFLDALVRILEKHGYHAAYSCENEYSQDYKNPGNVIMTKTIIFRIAW